MIPGHELKHLPIAEAMRVQRESIVGVNDRKLWPKDLRSGIESDNPVDFMSGVDWSAEDAELMRKGAFVRVNPPVINRIRTEKWSLLPIPTDGERRLLERLNEARREAAVLRCEIAASRGRELAQDAVILDLRRELLAAHDLLGQAEGRAPVKSVSRNPFRAHETDRRRIGS